MPKTLREKLKNLFKKPSLPVITDKSSLQEISEVYPQFYNFIQRKYAVKVSTKEKTQSLKDFVVSRELPPSQVVFMEVQMESRSRGVEQISAQEVIHLIQKRPSLSILDVREDWELKFGSLPNSSPLTHELLDEMLQKWEKDKPLLVYCHFGVRSLDAASFLADQGFKNVSILKGGIDSWSNEIDPNIPRYEGAYC